MLPCDILKLNRNTCIIITRGFNKNKDEWMDTGCYDSCKILWIDVLDIHVDVHAYLVEVLTMNGWIEDATLSIKYWIEVLGLCTHEHVHVHEVLMERI